MKAIVIGFLVALLALASPAQAQDATPAGTPLATPAATPAATVLTTHTSEGFGYQTVVPEGWTDAGQGLFMRAESPADMVVLVQQTSALAPDALLDALRPQLALTEAPEPVGAHEGVALTWTLYQEDVAAAGIDVRVDLALANQGRTTYLVLLQAPPEEYETLHAQVFLPTLDAFAPLVAEASPVAYVAEEVTFDNGDVTLAGTLTLPPGEGPFPAVVLVSGSGAQDRDESLPGIPIKPFALLADGLTSAGVAVLRYDDRGVGESTGDFDAATTADFATDAEAAIDFLLTRPQIDANAIGVVGHSEGGLVTAMLGARNPEVDFLISLAGPAVTGLDVLVLQNRLILEAEGASPEEIEDQLTFLDQLVVLLNDPDADSADIEELIYQNALAQMERLPDAEREALGDPEEYARAVAAQGAVQFNTWFATFLTYDPAADWAQTTVPVLAIYGGKDLQVDAGQSVPVLEAALAEAGNDNVTIVVLPDANHLFQVAETDSPTEYATLPAEFTPELLPTIIEWLAERVEIQQ